MQLIVVRHGESEGNKLHLIQGWKEYPLSPLGLAQAERAAKRLAPLGPMPVYSSDLGRARQTADLIAAAWGGEVISDPRWRELDCGQYNGASLEDYRRDVAMQKAFHDDPFNTPMPGGESFSEVTRRVMEALSELAKLEVERLVVVTHDGPLRALIVETLGIPARCFWNLATDNCGITRLVLGGKRPIVRAVNETAHLEELEGLSRTWP